MDWPNRGGYPPLWICNWTRFFSLNQGPNNTGVSANLNWPSANRAVYMPFALPFPYQVRRVFWANGTTASSNVDIGIYSYSGARLWSATPQGQSGATALQFVTPSGGILLMPDRYYLAVSCSGTTSRMRGNSGTLERVQLSGVLQEDSAGTLPATMTPAALASGVVPLCGLTMTDS